MQNIYRFSNVDKVNGFTKEQSIDLKRDVVNDCIITFIASTFNDVDKTETYVKGTMKHFVNIGIRFSAYHVITNDVTPYDARNLINKSDVIFLMGGDPKAQMKSINEYDLRDVIRDFKGVIIGVSAGAMNLGSRVAYYDENASSNMKYEKNDLVDYMGICLDDKVIYPHFDFDNFSMLREVFKISEVTKITVLPNKSYIKIENNKSEVVLDSYVFEDGNFIYEGYPVSEIKHLSTKRLVTDRLILRRQTELDIDELFFMQVNPLLRNHMGPYKLGNNIEKSHKFVKEMLSKYKEDDFYRWVIERKDNHEVIGCIMLNMHDERAKTAGIDYFLKHSEWSKGYMSEATREVMRFAFDDLLLERIESSGAKENPGTWKVMEKCGMKYEGERENALFYYYSGPQTMVYYGISKDEYKTLKYKK